MLSIISRCCPKLEGLKINLNTRKSLSSDVLDLVPFNDTLRELHISKSRLEPGNIEGVAIHLAYMIPTSCQVAFGGRDDVMCWEVLIRLLPILRKHEGFGETA